MNILIIGKSKIGDGVGVHGLVLDTNRIVNLLPHSGAVHKVTTSFNIGQIWDMETAEQKELQPPHLDEVRIKKAALIGQQDHLADFLQERVQPWRGGPHLLFDRHVRFTQAGFGSVTRAGGIPRSSSGFWIPDQYLEYRNFKGAISYLYVSAAGLYYLPYVGLETPHPVLKAGTLLHVTLSRWTPTQDEKVPERCYLQLAGWVGG